VADQLATPADLASLLERDDIDTYKATLLIEMATAIVQEACGGQRIVQVVDDVLTVAGYSDSWLPLPQLPVVAVSSVTIDGVALSSDSTVSDHWKKFGDRLFRKCGWQNDLGWWTQYGQWYDGPSWQYYNTSFTGAHRHGYGQEPSTVVVTYTHGYAPGAQELQLARQACLSLCAGSYANPTAVTSEHIDDYSVQYDAMIARMEAAPHLKAALAKKYGRRAALVRIG
jgi:hypothetical protein